MFVLRFTAPLIFLFCFTSISAAGLNSVFSKDASDVWAVGLNGYTIHSTNGGMSWVNVSLGNLTYNSVCSNNNPIGISQISTEVPKQFSLSQNYPNPFNPSTDIGFRISHFGFVLLVIYNVLGQEITTLANEQLKPGIYSVDWNAANYPSGVYFYKLIVGNNSNSESFIETKKMILLK